MILEQRFVPGLAIASYIVGDEKTRRAAVVDPVRDVEPYLAMAQQHGLRITDVMETHVHADYISGSRQLKAALPKGQVTIHCSGEGGEPWTPRYANRVIHDGDEVVLGSVRTKAVHTPGHTPEHLMWAVYDDERSSSDPWLLLTGDFLFVGDVGRPDLLGEAQQQQLAHELYRSVFDRLAPLPDFAEVHPGHGAGSLCGKAMSSRLASTLGYERRFNRSLRKEEEPRWTADLLDGMPAAPPYFARMKRVNREGPPILEGDRPGSATIAAGVLSVRLEQDEAAEPTVVLDTRSKEAFAAGYIPGAINIPLADNLPMWAGWVVPYDRPLVLVLAEPEDREATITHLLRIGMDDMIGHLEGGMEAWEAAGLPLASIETLSVHRLAERNAPGREKEHYTVLDVRTDPEWRRGHIRGAMHISLQQLASDEQSTNAMPTNGSVAVVCGSGYRASIAASLLKRRGFNRVANVIGGMTAWHAANLPLELHEPQAIG